MPSAKLFIGRPVQKEGEPSLIVKLVSGREEVGEWLRLCRLLLGRGCCRRGAARTLRAI